MKLKMRWKRGRVFLKRSAVTFRARTYFKRGLKRVALYGSEIVLVIAAVLICFALFLLGLKQIFPEGDPTRFWFRDGRGILRTSFPKGENGIEMNLPGSSDADSEGLILAAKLTFVQNEVKSKSSQEIAWMSANRGLRLYDRDAVQTLGRSRAVITFDEKNYLDMDENSLVIIKKLEQSRILKEKRSFMVVIDGSLRGRIDANGEENVKLEVATPTAEVAVNAKESPDRQADFQIHVNPDQTSTVTVYKGIAKVTAQGVMVEVKENQTTHIAQMAPPNAPKSILGPVTLTAPGEGDRFYYRDFPPELIFTWSTQEKGVLYHLQIGKEASFRERVLDEMVSKVSFLYGNLKGGTYLWRVSALDADRVEGQWSEVREIKVVQNRLPPLLKVIFPKGDQVINQEAIWVDGESDLQAKVYVNGKKIVKDPKGRFKQKVALKKGVNLILVESVDPAGNVSFQKRVISRKF
jgi:hypothetical protein